MGEIGIKENTWWFRKCTFFVFYFLFSFPLFFLYLYKNVNKFKVFQNDKGTFWYGFLFYVLIFKIDFSKRSVAIVFNFSYPVSWKLEKHVIWKIKKLKVKKKTEIKNLKQWLVFINNTKMVLNQKKLVLNSHFTPILVLFFCFILFYFWTVGAHMIGGAPPTAPHPGSIPDGLQGEREQLTIGAIPEAHFYVL